jgi:hypothetical protein
MAMVSAHVAALDANRFRATILNQGSPGMLGGLIEAEFEKPALSRRSMLGELQRRAMEEHAARAIEASVHEEALQVDALITLAMASAVDNTDPEIGSVRDVIMDAIERFEYQHGITLAGDVIAAATAEVTARLA